MSERRSQPWVTYALIAANLAVFAYELGSGADASKPTPQKMVELGGNFAPLTLHGEWWRLGSSMFLHYGVMHVALNMVCLFQARVVEKLFGHAGFIAIYAIAGLAGSVTSVEHASNVVSAGASGAVFGVFGAFGAYLALRRATMPDEAWQKTARSIATFVVINLVYGMATPGIDMSAHIGGMIAGFVIGAGLLAGARADSQRVLRAIVITVAGIALAGVAIVAIPTKQNIDDVLGDFDKTEHASIKVYSDALTGFTKGTLTEAQFADTVERDVIPPYRKVREAISSIEPVAKTAPMLDALKTYTASRLASWEATIALHRATTPEQRSQLSADLDVKMRQMYSDLADVNAEIEKLK